MVLGSAPSGHATALVLAHVVDSPRAFANVPAIAAIERDRGTRATFLVVTRTVASGGTALLDGTQVAMLQALERGGFDVAAAGVAPEAIARASAGSGTEAYPGYAPSAARGGTTMAGEARVSRHILGSLTERAPVVFGPPQLVPAAGVGDGLEDAVAAAGYEADLAVPAEAVGGSLPYRPATTGDAATERSLLRVPVAFDDAAGAVRVDQRGAELDALVAHAVATGAPATVRIAPAGGTTATFALQRLLAGVSPDVWTGDATTFARFWSARYGLAVDVEPGEERLRRAPHRQGQGAVADPDPAVRRQPRRRTRNDRPPGAPGRRSSHCRAGLQRPDRDADPGRAVAVSSSRRRRGARRRSRCRRRPG